MTTELLRGLATYVVKTADKNRLPIALIPASSAKMAYILGQKLAPDTPLFVEEVGHLEFETIGNILIDVCRYANSR